jgi:hypothetical protein
VQFDDMAGVIKREKPEENWIAASQTASTAQQTNLAEYLDARPEIGFTKMLFNLALEPPDPFKPDERRTARKGLVVSALFFVALVAWFVWFSVIR